MELSGVRGGGVERKCGLSTESMTATATLRLGEDAPDFTLPGTDGRDHTLSAYRGKRHVVLTFFPYAFSNTCSAQMPGYQTQLDRFTSADTQVLGISMDSKHSLAAWAAGIGLSFPCSPISFRRAKWLIFTECDIPQACRSARCS